ncbi:MAG: DUF1232 domain-containing protein [Anaerolineales bacterium]|nr:DUF1232 domain-containing protein [Anaerolineales bacterium]
MNEKKPNQIVPTQQSGVVHNIINQAKLIFRLMGDKRVSLLAKLIPVGALIYLVSPADAVLLPYIGPIDDAALLWLGSYIFTELCPPAVVKEHMQALAGEVEESATADDVVDAETTDFKED